MAKIKDLTMLTDILPTGFQRRRSTQAVGCRIYRLRLPVRARSAMGCRLASAYILGAGQSSIVGDMNAERLAHVQSCWPMNPIDLTRDASLEDQIRPDRRQTRGSMLLQSMRVGFEAKVARNRNAARRRPQTVSQFAHVHSPARQARIGIPGLYVTEDPGRA